MSCIKLEEYTGKRPFTIDGWEKEKGYLFVKQQSSSHMYSIYLQKERVHVMDTNVMTKICNGKFYHDRKKMAFLTLSQFS